MSEKTSVKCDFCNKELVVDSPYPHNYCLHLSVKDYGINSSGATYMVMQYPPIDSPKDFCEFGCLAGWLVKE